MRFMAALVAILAMVSTTSDTRAQSNYPNRPVRIVVGFAPAVPPILSRAFLARSLPRAGANPF